MTSQDIPSTVQAGDVTAGAPADAVTSAEAARRGKAAGLRPAERAAVLSARIHREINAGRFVLSASAGWMNVVDYDGVHRCVGCALGAAAMAVGTEAQTLGRTGVFDRLAASSLIHYIGECRDLEDGFEHDCARCWQSEHLDTAFYRLGAELRAIVLGNRGTP